MANNWKTLKIDGFLPADIGGAIGSLETLVSGYLDQYTPTKKLSSLFGTITANPNDIKTKIADALLKAAKGLLDSLINTGKIQVLYLPIPKPISGGSGPGLFNIANENTVSATARELYMRAIDANTDLGNSGFYRRFVDSLTDVGDINRPQYTDTDYVACTALVAGSNNFSTLIRATLTFDNIFNTGSESLVNRVLPIPQNLKTGVISLPGLSKTGIKLDWDALENGYSPEYFPVTITPLRTAIIRSTSVDAPKARTVFDLFETQTLKKGLKSGDGKTEVVDIVSGALNTYTDKTELKSGTVYYYMLAWELSIVDALESDTITWDKLSNVTKLASIEPTEPPGSIKPDWKSIKSPMALIPGVEKQLNTALDQLTNLLTKNRGAASSFLRQAALLEATIQRHKDALNKLNFQAKKLRGVLSLNSAISTTSFSGLGGNKFLIEELGNRLFDFEDTSRPGFDSAEYVMGVVIVVGGPNEGAVAGTLSLLNLLFGSSTANKPLLDAIDSLGDIITDEETKVFGPDMKTKVPKNTVDPLTGEVTATIDTNTGKNKPSSAPVTFSDDFTVTPSDASNNTKNKTTKVSKPKC